MIINFCLFYLENKIKKNNLFAKPAMNALRSIVRYVLGTTSSSPTGNDNENSSNTSLPSEEYEDLIVLPAGRLHQLLQKKDSEMRAPLSEFPDLWKDLGEFVLGVKKETSTKRVFLSLTPTTEVDRSTEAANQKARIFEIPDNFAKVTFEDAHTQKEVTKQALAAFSWTEGKERFVVEVERGRAGVMLLEMLHVSIAQCLYERASGRKTPRRESDLDAHLHNLVITFESSEREKEATMPDWQEAQIVYKAGNAVAFYQYDPEKAVFVLKEPFLRLLLYRISPQEYWMRICTDADLDVHSQLIQTDAAVHCDHPTVSFSWAFSRAANETATFSLRFGEQAELAAFSHAYASAAYEILNSEKLAALNAPDSRFLMGQFATNVVEDVEMGEPSEEEGGEEEEAVRESESEESDKESPIKDLDQTFSRLVVGYKHDRSFVTHGKKLAVFRHTSDDRIQGIADLDISTSSGSCVQSFAPSGLLLHNQDSRMLLQDPSRPTSVFCMDLDRGKVVDEWHMTTSDSSLTNQMQSAFAIESLVPSAKYSQMTPEATVIGVGSRSIFRIDPRLPGVKRVAEESKTYQTKTAFACGATTGSGNLAVASARGELRLFSGDRLDKRAKTLLPMFGDAILGVDVTEDGKWILCTCRTYLLLLKAEGAETHASGFSGRGIPSDDRAAPLRLQLKPEHVAHTGPVSFTPARFSTGPGEERAIITSTGPFVVTWNLRRAKLGHPWDYSIKRYDETVVADSFRYGAHRSIVVTLPHHVTVVSKEKLQAPTPRSLSSKN